MRNNVSFILVRPQFLGNIGSIARVLKNFGFSSLRLVQPPRNYKDAEARKMSVGAFDLLKQAQVFATLSDALADVNLAVGTTSGKQREVSPLPIAAISAELTAGAAAGNRVAIVLGDEVNGLPRADLERCHHVITVPTDAQFPALNVAQAAGIIAYELTRQPPAAPGAPVLYSVGKDDDKMFAALGDILDAAGFSRSFNRQGVLSELRQFYQRAHPTAREADLLSGALMRINQKLADR